MISSRLRNWLRWSLRITIGLFVLLALVVLIAVRLIDTPKIHTQLTEKLSQLLHGQVSWQALEVRLLPQPHAVIHGVHVAIPNVLTVDVGMARVNIGLLPLLRGNTELQGITLERPDVNIWISAVADQESPGHPPQPTAPVALYRNAMRPVLNAVARFAPVTTLAITNGRVTCHVGELPPFEARELQLKAVTDGKGIALDASASGTYWSRVAIDGRVEFSDSHTQIKVQASELKLQPALEAVLGKRLGSWVLSNAGVNLQAATDGHTDIGIDFGISLPKADVYVHESPLSLGPVRMSGSVKFLEENIAVGLNEIRLGELANAATATLMLTGAQRVPKLDIAVGEFDLARVRDTVMKLAAGRPQVTQYIARVHGGRLRAVRLSTQADSFAELSALPNVQGSVDLVDASMNVPTLEREATDIRARIELVSGVIRARDVSAQVGASQLREAGADLVLLKPMRLEHTRGRATVVLQDLLPGLRARKPFAKLFRSIPKLSGLAETTVHQLALRFDRPSRITYDLSVSPRNVRLDTDRLPGAVRVHGGSLRVTSKSISANRVEIEVLDSMATVSGELTEWRGGNPQARASAADGFVSVKLINWIWPRAHLSERLKPRKSVGFTAPRVEWNKTGLDVAAEATVKAGPSLSIDLSARDKTFTLHRATLKDGDSDARVTLTVRDSLMEGAFSGVLAARSLATIVGLAAESYPGRVSGTIQATLDLTQQGRIAARGELSGEQVDLFNFTGTPLKLVRFDMQGDGTALKIRDLILDWAGQKASVRGALARRASGIGVTLDIDSPGIVVDALHDTRSGSSVGATEDTKSKPRQPFSLWSLPISGTVSLRTAFVAYRGYRVQDIRAVATLQREMLTVNVTEASLCGIDLPLALQMTPRQLEANLRITAVNQSLEHVAQCLGDVPVIMTGAFNMTSALTVTGTPEQISESWTRHLAGSAEFSARNGEIRKMALLGNVLSLKSVSDLLKGNVGLGEQGFKYRSFAGSAKIEDGQMTIEQAALDSPALGLAAQGTINLENDDCQLTLLVAPFGALDRTVRRTPLVGYVIGGALTSIPVGVTGDVRNPLVAPLGPRAVGSEVLGLFERTFKLPGKIVEPLSQKPGN